MITSIAVLQEHHKQNLSGKPLFFAIEEPEVHLHPHAQRMLLNYFRWFSNKHQTIITTHSPILIDKSSPDSVTVVRRALQKDQDKSQGVIKAGTTQVVPAPFAKNWKAVVDSLGLRLSDILMAGEVNLVVEGPTEKILFSAMAKAIPNLNVENVEFDFERVFIVEGEGGNLPHLVKLLKATGNPIMVVVDNDKGGREILKKVIDDADETFQLPNPKAMTPPLSAIKQAEIEDLLDPEILLDAFNETYQGRPGYEFLPLSYWELEQERLRLFQNNKDIGWVNTVGTIIGRKTSSIEIRARPEGERFSKVLVAQTAASYLVSGKMPIPEFFQSILVKLANLAKI